MRNHRSLFILGGFFTFVLSFWVFIHYRRGCFFIEGMELMCSDAIEVFYFVNIALMLFSFALVSCAILASRD